MYSFIDEQEKGNDHVNKEAQMKKSLINIFIYFIAITLLNITQGHAQANEFNLEQTKRVLTGQIEEALKSSGGASISISLVKEDKIVWSAAFGYSNIRAKSVATTDTIYNTASTFKPVTATAIMQLVEKKKINLDDPIHKYLDEQIIKNWGKREKKVTFRHILSHQSGFAPDVISQNHINIWRRDKNILASLDGIASELKSNRDPEVTYEYNNLAFAVLGLLVEKVSGISYEEYLVNNILKPIGVYTANPVSPTPKMVEMMAYPYIREKNGSLIPAELVQYSIYPAGDIYLTAEDMARFIGAILNEGVFNSQHILSKKSIQEMCIPQFGGPYGLGFHINKDDKGHVVLRHTGATDNGFSSIMLCDIDSRVGVYFMSNFSGGNNILDLTVALQLLQGDYVPPEERKTITLNSNILDMYVGEYQVQNIVLAVIRKGDNLFLKLPFAPEPAQLYAESETVFFTKDEYTTNDVKFMINENNDVTSMIIVWRGQKVPLQKVK